MINYKRSVSYTMDLMSAARGEYPADLIIKNGRLINVDTSEIYKADIAIKDSFIIAVGDVDYCIGKETRIIDAVNKKECSPAETSLSANIGIHGMGKYNFIFKNLPFIFNWTNGSIAVSDESIDELYPLVKIGTKVTIMK